MIGKTIIKLHFWQNTGATIIAVYRNDELLISPDPHFILGANDIIIFIGTEAVTDKVKKYISL